MTEPRTSQFLLVGIVALAGILPFFTARSSPHDGNLQVARMRSQQHVILAESSDRPLDSVAPSGSSAKNSARLHEKRRGARKNHSAAGEYPLWRRQYKNDEPGRTAKEKAPRQHYKPDEPGAGPGG